MSSFIKLFTPPSYSVDQSLRFSNTNYRYCYPCISKWAEIESKCPFCKLRFSKIVRKLLASPNKLAAATGDEDRLQAALPGTVLETEFIPERNQRVVFEDPNFQQWIDHVVCLVCGAADNDDQLLLCDGMSCKTF